MFQMKIMIVDEVCTFSSSTMYFFRFSYEI